MFDGNLGPVADHLILEASLLGNSEPFTKQKISSYILDFMIHAGTEDLIKKHNMAAFNVQALSVKRTLCEKIMSLVRFSQVEDRDL